MSGIGSLYIGTDEPVAQPPPLLKAKAIECTLLKGLEVSMGDIIERNRQADLLPPSMCYMLSEGYLSWFIIDSVNKKGLSELYLSR